MPDNLKRRLPELISEGYSGFNLTLPHKELALPLCDYVDETAQQIGAVNTIFVRGGELHGTNTDMFGFIENIKAQHSGFDFVAGPAVVLGAGGAARAIVHGLLQEGAPEILILNRTRSKAEALAADTGDRAVRVADWGRRSETLSGAHLLVNTTALGMAGKANLDINLVHLPVAALVADIVYVPLYTDLLRAAQARGNPICTGFGMLLQQARPAFEKWYGIMPDVDDYLVGLIEK
jgi:shikimate dehydrogenase